MNHPEINTKEPIPDHDCNICINKYLVAFESGHYKQVVGNWAGDRVWGHYEKNNGRRVHVNLSKVEYIEEL